MKQLRKQGEINGGPPNDSENDQKEEFVQLINIKTFYHVLAKQTLVDFQVCHGKDLIEDVLPVQQCKRTIGEVHC